MSVSPTSPTTAASANNVTYDPATRTVQKTLGQQDFLSLLTTQLQNQDPMNPMKDTDFIAQMAQFTSLQQTSDMAKTLTGLASTFQQTQANSYLGCQVTLTDAQGNPVTGIVTSVGNSNGKPVITINGKQYDASTVKSVSIPTNQN